MCIDNETYPDVGALMELQDREIATTVRKIFATQNWAWLRKANPGISDLDLLKSTILMQGFIAMLRDSSIVFCEDEFIR